MDNLNFAVIGNCRSAALVSEKGSIDWCCLPEFNSPSVFAKILDLKKGGYADFSVDNAYEITQKYVRNTNLLSTLFSDGKNCFEVIDFMPRYLDDGGGHHTPPDIIRYIRLISGRPKFKVRFQPRLEYGLKETRIVCEKEYLKAYTVNGVYDSLYLYSSLNREAIRNEETLEIEQDAFILISYNQKLLKQTLDRVYLKMERTKVYWLGWADKSKRFPLYNDEILRSAMVLKLLSFDKSGAVLAALTTSIPETIGEVRNWDYRFCWLRDASMVVKIMRGLGHNNIAKRYLKFITTVISDKDEKIQIMYAINGEKKLTEVIMDHLNGYEGSKPVRIGNDAYRQKQNDIYGFLMDVLYQQFQFKDISLEDVEDLWTVTRSIIRAVAKNWQKPDRGIWEFRTEKKHFTFSKLLSWVAVDRGIKIAELIHRGDYVAQWSVIREKIKSEIHRCAWNEKKNAFTQAYGSNDMDASNLLMESYGFIEADDSKFIGTVKATQRELSHHGLMYRYKNKDDFGLPKSSFTICTFWLINALYKIGEKTAAKKLFDRLLTYSNHVQIFSEDIDFESKRLLGNFPQAYSHLALIETAINLSGHVLPEKDQELEALL